MNTYNLRACSSTISHSNNFKIVGLSCPLSTNFSHTGRYKRKAQSLTPDGLMP